MKERKPIDAICQHSRDGDIIPIKIRLQDEDGVYQEYKIQRFRPLEVKAEQRTADGVYVSSMVQVYECRIIVFQREKTILLYYRKGDGIWSVYI